MININRLYTIYAVEKPALQCVGSADIMADKEFTQTLSLTFCLFNSGCDGEQEAIKANI